MQPSRKVVSGGLAGALTGLIVFAVHSFTDIKIDADTAVYISTVITFLVQYVVKDAQ